MNAATKKLEMNSTQQQQQRTEKNNTSNLLNLGKIEVYELNSTQQQRRTEKRKKPQTQKKHTSNLLNLGEIKAQFMDDKLSFVYSGCPTPIKNNTTIISKPNDSSSNSIVLLNICNNQKNVVKISYDKLYKFSININNIDPGENILMINTMYINLNNNNHIETCYIDNNSRFLNDTICEALIYKYLNKLIKHNITPHVLQFYGGKIVKFTDMFNVDEMSENNKMVTKKLFRIKSGIDKNNEYLFLQNTEYINNKRLFKLAEFLEFVDDNKSDWYMFNMIVNIIIFQVLYTLECFKVMGVKHNDLHLDNIFVYVDITNDGDDILTYNIKKYLSRPTHTNYVFNGKTYNIPYIGITAKIYDFDASTKFKTEYDNSEYLPISSTLHTDSLASIVFTCTDFFTDKFKFLLSLLKNISTLYDEKTDVDDIFNNIFLNGNTYESIFDLYCDGDDIDIEELKKIIHDDSRANANFKYLTSDNDDNTNNCYPYFNLGNKKSKSKSKSKSKTGDDIGRVVVKIDYSKIFCDNILDKICDSIPGILLKVKEFKDTNIVGESLKLTEYSINNIHQYYGRKKINRTRKISHLQKSNVVVTDSENNNNRNNNNNRSHNNNLSTNYKMLLSTIFELGYDDISTKNEMQIYT